MALKALDQRLAGSGSSPSPRPGSATVNNTPRPPASNETPQPSTAVPTTEADVGDGKDGQES